MFTILILPMERISFQEWEGFVQTSKWLIELGFKPSFWLQVQCCFQYTPKWSPCSVSERNLSFCTPHVSGAGRKWSEPCPWCSALHNEGQTVQPDPRAIVSVSGCGAGRVCTLCHAKAFLIGNHAKRHHAPHFWALGAAKRKLKGQESSLAGALHTGTLFMPL